MATPTLGHIADTIEITFAGGPAFSTYLNDPSDRDSVR
jgi:hypothetical protein